MHALNLPYPLPFSPPKLSVAFGMSTACPDREKYRNGGPTR